MQATVGDRYFITWAQMGSPSVRGDYKVPGLGIVVFDDADAHFAATNSDAAFFVRPSKALGEGRFVVVSRVQTA